MLAGLHHLEEGEDTRVRAASLVLHLRSIGISDRAVLNAIETLPREAFVPTEWQEQAYSDRSLPIDCGQTIGPPSLVGLMTAALDLCDRHGVLEIGTGSGYQTAILARLARRVTTVERFRTLSRAAEARWQALGIRNISAVVADGANGWPRQAPFDRILVTAALQAPPARLIAQLSETGILIAPLGRERQRLTLFQRLGESVATRDLGPARFEPLISGVAQTL
jgi:protein-L-isoaspartate(D-aspartate) O-methyltransferase